MVKKDLGQGVAIVPLMFNVALKISIRSSKVEIRGNIFDKCSQIVAYADDVVVTGRRLQDVEMYLHHWSNKQIRWH